MQIKFENATLLNGLAQVVTPGSSFSRHLSNQSVAFLRNMRIVTPSWDKTFFPQIKHQLASGFPGVHIEIIYRFHFPRLPLTKAANNAGLCLFTSRRWHFHFARWKAHQGALKGVLRQK